MFNILRNPKASSEELAQAYIKAIAFEKTLATEKTKAYEALMAAQVECFSAKPTKEFLSAKKKLDDISTRIEGCQFGQQQLKNRLGEVLQREATLRLEKIQEELANVSDEEKGLKQKYLDLCARGAVTRELIRGQALTHDNNGNYRVTIPSLEVKLHLMDLKDGKIYSDRVEHYRKELQVRDFSQTIRGRRDDLVQEREKLEKSLSADPLQNAQELLERLCPPPTPEPTVVAEPPKSHPSYESKAFIRNYGEGLGPDYGDGPALPYKGINEVLRDRANS